MFFNKLPQFYNLKKLVISHLGVLVYFLDPVASPQAILYQQISSNFQNVNFIFPFVYLVAIVFMYGNLPMIYKYISSSGGSIRKPDSSQLNYYPAGVFPLEMWPQSEVSGLLAFGTAAAVFTTFVGRSTSFNIAGRFEVVPVSGNKKANSSNHQQLVTINGKKLTATVSAAILKTHNRLHWWFFKAVFYIWLVAIIFCYTFGILINGAYKVSSAGDALFLFLLCPLHIGYLFYGLFGVSIFVVMACSFLNIRQRDQLEKLLFIEASLAQHQDDSKPPLPLWKLEALWLKYISSNWSIISLATEIEHYSALWTTSLTVYLSGFICLQCYVVYIVFFIRNVSFASKFLFLYGLIEVEVFQFVLIHICAKVAKTNGAIEKVNRSLGCLFSRLYLNRCSSLGGADLKCLLKTEWLQRSQRLKPYCMHLLDNYRITSKTFYMSISYNALFFLMIFKRQ